MATTARRELFKMVAQRIDPQYWIGTVTGASTAAIVDTSLKTMADDNAGIVSLWVTLLKSGSSGAAPEGSITRVPSSGAYTASSGTLNVEPDFSAITIVGDDYMLTAVNPADIGREIDRATRTLFPFLYLPIKDETLIIDNILTNGALKTFASSAFTSWTAVNVTATQETGAYVLQGTSSAKVVETSSGNTSGLRQSLDTLTPSHMQAGMESQTATIACWAWASSASTARFGVSFDGGSTYTYTGYHTGGRDWELLSTTVAWEPTSTKFALLNVAADATAYFNSAWVAVNPIDRYTIPTTIEHGPHAVMQQYQPNQPNGIYYPIARNFQPMQGRAIRVEGMGRLSTPSTMAGTVEIDQSRAELIATVAALYLVHTDDNVRHDRLLQERNELIRQPGIRMITPTMQIPDTFHFDQDAGGRYIAFERSRATSINLS